MKSIQTSSGETIHQPSLYLVRDHKHSAHHFKLLCLHQFNIYHLNKNPSKHHGHVLENNKDLYGVDAISNKNPVLYYNNGVVSHNGYNLIIGKNGEMLSLKENSNTKKDPRDKIYFEDYNNLNDSMNLIGNQTNIKNDEKRIKKLTKVMIITHIISYLINITKNIYRCYMILNFSSPIHKHGKLAIIQLSFDSTSHLNSYLDSMYGFHIGKHFYKKSARKEEWKEVILNIF